MGSWKDLPPEIQNLVFCQLRQRYVKVLTQYQLTCKNWHDQAQRNQYKEINLDRPNQIMKLLTTLSFSNSSPGRYVQGIDVYCWDDDTIVPYAGLLRLLLSRCPNIEKIDIDCEANNVNVFGEIRIAYEMGACKRLKCLPELKGESQEFNGEYYRTLYCLRSSLEKLVLDENQVTNSNITTNSLLQSLNEFPNMRSLTVKLKRMETMYRIGECIGSCPALEELVFNGFYVPSTSEVVPSIMPCPNIKSLHFTNIFVTKKLLEYTMQAFPNLVEFSTYEMEENCFMDYSDITNNISNTISSSLWVKFFVYLSRVKNIRQMSPLYITEISGVLTDYFNVMQSKNINLYIKYLLGTSGEPFVFINHPSRRNRAREELNSDMAVFFRLVQGRDEPPHLQLLRTAGCFLKSLELRSGYSSINRPSFCLGQTVQHCPSLVKLKLSNWALLNNNSWDSPTNRSIKLLTLDRCRLPQDIFPELSHQLLSLSKLCIRNYFQANPNGNDARVHSNYTIEMPNTSFDNLMFQEYSCGTVSKFTSAGINLKIATLAKCYYYFIDHYMEIESSDITFRKSQGIQTELSMYIKCRDIKEFQLSVDGCSWSFKFTEQ